MKRLWHIAIVLSLMSFGAYNYEKLTVIIWKISEDETYRYYQFDSVYHPKTNRVDLKVLYIEKYKPSKLQLHKKYKVDAIKRNPIFDNKAYETTGKILLDSCDKEEKYTSRNKNKDCVSNCISVYAEYYEIIDFEKLK